MWGVSVATIAKGCLSASFAMVMAVPQQTAQKDLSTRNALTAKARRVLSDYTTSALGVASGSLRRKRQGRNLTLGGAGGLSGEIECSQTSRGGRYELPDGSNAVGKLPPLWLQRSHLHGFAVH